MCVCVCVRMHVCVCVCVCVCHSQHHLSSLPQALAAVPEAVEQFPERNGNIILTLTTVQVRSGMRE